jgi:hypothetical protein
MPNLSLKPKADKFLLNAIDNYAPPKLNCYNFLDGDKVEGF